jgi:hypothetical protein
MTTATTLITELKRDRKFKATCPCCLEDIRLKSGNARLSSAQNGIKEAVESGAVRFGLTPGG